MPSTKSIVTTSVIALAAVALAYRLGGEDLITGRTGFFGRLFG